VDGRANAALIEFIAEAFDLPRARVVIEQGLSGRDKRLRLHDAPPVSPELQALIDCR
jgi:uncharacterized protein YggU (UPF0235/DUF167 family)